MTDEPIWDRPEPAGGGPTLSRAHIVRTAVAIADAEGTEALTMRRIASELGSSTPMSLYRYVGNKDGLVDLVLDDIYGRIQLPAKRPGDWRATLRTLAKASFAVMLEHPWFAALSHTRPPFGPNALRRIDFGLSAFAGLELPPGTAMSYFSLVDGLCLGTALQIGEELKMRRRIGVTDEDQLRQLAGPMRERSLARGSFPHYAAWMAAGAEWDSRVDFDFMLDCLLDGLAARLPT
ncbi:TetR/AcrR family transcriptional regulator [Fodinicola acaciae]|uniref:TetR/AcrR family transcriptional regulator n=1 Tax=Fodinicola acaciae TaxID=2681555 RepID=UPI0013D7F765|nr:TetR/AcrR family transcriptional regulator [Fodinicola acaciae]